MPIGGGGPILQALDPHGEGPREGRRLSRRLLGLHEA